MSRKTKCLMVLNDLDWFWSHRLPLAKAILEKGYDLHLAVAGAESDEGVWTLGITPHDLPVVARSMNPLAHLESFWTIAKILRREKPDIVHAITIRCAFYTALVNLFAGRFPAVYTIAGTGPLFSGQSAKVKIIRAGVVTLMRIVFRRPAVRIIFQNNDDKNLLLKSGAVAESQLCVIRGSGVDVTQFAATKLPVTDVPVVLLPSRLLVEKGIYDFVQAARLLKAQGVHAWFQIAGGLEENNPRAVKKQDLDNWVSEGIIEYLGKRRDMPDVLKAATLVVLPSYYAEGVPKALLEAAATARPIITCDMPGCREAVEDGVNGLLVPPKNPAVLAEKIKTLLDNPALCTAFGAAGRQRIESDFTVEQVVTKTLAVYEELM